MNIDLDVAHTIQSIETYIRNTRLPEKPDYSPRVDIITHLAKYGQQETPREAVYLAFQYGQAKGYRQAKNELKNAKKVNDKNEFSRT